MLLLAVAVPLTIAGALVAHPAQEGMVVLQDNLDPATARALQHELQVRRVPFATKGGGHTILVPASLRAELIIELPHTPRALPDAAAHPAASAGTSSAT